MSVAYSPANDRAPMFRVSLILEALRARPVLMFWVAALAQGTLWTLVPVAVLSRRRPARCRSCSRSARNCCSARPTGRRSPSGSPIWRSASPAAAWSASICCRSSAWSVTYLGGVRARPPHRRRRACHDGDPADGRHQRVHGADARIRPGRAGDAAHRADAAVRLSGARRQPARRLDPASARRSACCCSRPMRG